MEHLVVSSIVESCVKHLTKHLGFLVSSTNFFEDMNEEMDQLNLTEQDIQERKMSAEVNTDLVSHHVPVWLEDVIKVKEKAKSISTTGIGCLNLAKRYKVGKQSYKILKQIKTLQERGSNIIWTNERNALAKVLSTSAPAPHGTQIKFESLFVSSTNFLKDMNEEMGRLNLTEQDIQERKMRAEVNNHVVSHHVSVWLEDVNKVKEKAKSISTTGIGSFNLAKRYKVVKQSYKIVKQIKALQERGSKINWTNERKALAKVLSTSAPASHGTQIKFESRDLVFNAALQSLQSNDESQKIIALCGMNGVGKTTMMEHLRKVVEDSKMFDWVVKVVIGENTDPFALQEAISNYIHEDLTENNKDARAERLRMKFEAMSQKGQNKILVIMDDIWEEVDLKVVGLTSPLPNGFKLLLTTRCEYVCTKMGVRANSMFKVQVLNDAEAKTLFFETMGSSMLDGDDPELYKIGEDIVNKCGGLPIALTTIAKSLTGEIKEVWKETLSSLQLDDHKDLNGTVYRGFEMSYNNLKNEDDKSIFLLSALFPNDFDIPIEDLLRYAWGLKLFTKVHTLTEARRRTVICVNNLVRAHMLTESECMGCVKMHGLVRAFALGSFSKVKQASIVYHEDMSEQRLIKEAKDSYERILLKCTGMSNVDFDYPNLSLLIVMDGNNLLKFPQGIYEKTKNLEVVSYENMGIPLLPKMFEHSTKLRTLYLRSCLLIDDISFLGSLCNLETLTFAYCNIRRLPSTVRKLKKLRLLDFTKCDLLCVDDGVFQDLDSLEELYIRACSHTRFTSANCKELENLSPRLSALALEFFNNEVQPKNVSFKNLETFRISVGCEMTFVEEYSFRNTLNLVTKCDLLMECNISDIFEKTKELHLQVDDMTHLEVITMQHSFSNLSVLHVCNCTKLTYLFTVAVASGLVNLEQLRIFECPIMRTLVGEDLTHGVIRFPKLNSMSLVDLPSMVSLCGTVLELPEMVELSFHGLPNFTNIYPDNSNPYDIQSLLNKKVVILKLEKLNIYNMKNLKQIWPCDISTNVSTLRKIHVRRCDSLINFFPNNPLPMLNNLEELKVEQCGSIEVIFNIDFENVIEMCNSRLRSIHVQTSGKLKELWRLRGLDGSNIIIDGFQGVQSIHISYCESFQNIFTPITANFDLGSLTDYIAKGINVISEVDDYYSNVTYPSYLLHTCRQLKYLHLCNDERVEEVVFDMDSPSNRNLATIHPQPLLPCVESISLDGLEMSHVWKGNWNKFFIPQHQPLQFPFQNLTDITLWECHRIKYLFSPLMAKYLFNLKKVILQWCYGIEEVISRRDDENEDYTTAAFFDQDPTFFPHLDTLQLEFLKCLKSVDEFQSGQVISDFWSLCQYPRKISVTCCPAMSSLIPWYAIGQMKTLEELKIKKCKTMMEVFESTPIINVDNGGAGPTLPSLPLNNATIVAVPQLSNLKSVSITGCDLLPYIFTFSTFESLKQLKHLIVAECKAMQVIIKEENETLSQIMVFPRLETLRLDDLPNLKGFFLGKNDFRWPSLDRLLIKGCPELVMFTSGRSTTPKLKYIHTSFGKYSLEYGLNSHETNSQTTFPTSSDPTISKWTPCSFHNLIDIDVRWKAVEMTIIPSNALLQLEKLQQIHLSRCWNVKEVFEVASEWANSSGFNASQTAVKIPNLTQLYITDLDGLKYLWKSNQWMVLKFPNLTTVSIDKCNSLEHLFTCSMAGSLVQLQDLNISSCDKIEVIVKDEEEECDAKVNEVMLPRLKSLKLEDLPSLEGFCLGKEAFSLPTLETLQIKECPAITVFTKGHVSTPELKILHTVFGICYVKTDINSFIRTKQEEGCEF
ncbi:putative P-loop containing nucleoside triphosphate hydrolase, leucine-rich repeat domain superfamily [Helianthus anomalus]